MPRRATGLVLALAIAWAAPARADDSKQRAAEHFALGERAEKREDWQAAIDEFELAYQIKPHPAVLFKIAKNHERLAHWDDAADYYQRYLDDSPGASDRARVDQKIGELRDKAAAERPAAPPGRGVLIVRSNVEGAAVTGDGQPLGATPLVAEVAPGDHDVVVAQEGYMPARRTVRVPPGGTESIRMDLVPVAGGPPQPLKASFLFDFAYGYVLPEPALRFVLALGYRFPSERLDALFVFGAFGPADSGVGVEARYFLSTRKVRPYLHLMASYGKARDTGSEPITYGVEAGGGALVSIGDLTDPRRHFMAEYFVQVDARLTGGGEQSETATTRTEPFSVPLQFGVILRFY